MRTLSLLSACIILALCSDCKYEPEPVLPGKTTPAKAGSTYTFKNIQTDTLNKPIDSSLYYSRDSVAETGMSYSGKSNVTHIISTDITHGTPGGDTYINFETNGDISVYVGGAALAGIFGITLPDWTTYTVQTHTTTGFKIADTSISLQPQGSPIPISIHITLFDTSSFGGNDYYTAAGGSIPVFKGKDVVTFNAEAFLLLKITTPTVTHIEFAPSLGYIVSTITDPTLSTSGYIPSQGGSQSTLSAYVLK